MTQRHAIELALDLARMPALARTSVARPIPSNILELMRIAAASPKVCQDAAKATGEPVEIVIGAARFYLQHLLFRAEADCYRVLGLQPGASRATARSHMRWLLQWLHPDRNRELDAVYAERVIKAWREMSSIADTAMEPKRSRAASMNGAFSSFRVPWIKFPVKGSRASFRSLRSFATWGLTAGMVVVVLLFWSAVYYFDAGQTAIMVSVP